MNILLAFKAEPDPDMLSSIGLSSSALGANGPDPGMLRRVIGCDELGAAELMLQLRDSNPQVMLSAMTLGDEGALPLLRHLAALGFAQRTLLTCQADLRFSPAFVAEQIAAQVKKQSVSLVLTGTQSSEGQNGQTGWLLAEILGWPCLSGVTGLKVNPGGVEIQCEDLHQRSLWQVNQPAVLRVQNRGQMALRVPGLRARLAAGSAQITQETVMSGADGSLTCRALTKPPLRRAGEIIDSGSVQARAQRLWHEYLAVRMGQ